MSSPAAPPPVPPMVPVPPRRRRSFAGALILILLGVLFLLGNLHMLSWFRIVVWFAHYWPVLLILWGVVKLIEHYQAQREGTRPSGIGAGGVLLLVLIVVFGLIATQAERLNWSGLKDNFNLEDGDFDNIFGETYNFNDHLEHNFPAGASLKVLDDHGAVSVHPSDDDNITVVVRKRVGADNRDDADKYDRETKPTITTIGGLVTVDAKTNAAGDHPVETDIDISVPRKAPVSIASRRGDINVVDRDANVDISSQHADTSVENINGNVKITQEKGSLKIEQVTGDVHVDGRLDEVSVSDVKGSAQLDGGFDESVKLERMSKTVSFKSSRTDMECSRIDGSLDLDSDDLHAETIAGPVHLITHSKNIRLDEVSGDVRLQDDNGTVEVGMRNVGNVQIDSRNGDVQVGLPDKAGFRIDARARDGEIQSEFPEIKVNNDEHESRASGTVGNGAAHIVVNNEHEGIAFRKASLTPPRPPTPPKPGKALPAPAEKVEPTEN
jgi:DUF4097 and DUF4098 domain-containing protein YvlB